jgi:Family of unknown function (DUF6364)
MSKLTLSVDDRVIARAKLHAKQRGVSISEMVEVFLDEIAEAPSADVRDAPILRSVRGSLKRAHVEDYQKHLAAKYR